MSRYRFVAPLLLLAGVAAAEEAPSATQSAKEEEAKRLLGISILGNQEAPKSLVIVPWKSSELGASLGISPMLDDSRQPVDREVFVRALGYYRIRSESTHPEGAPAGGRDAAAADSEKPQPATAARRRHS